MLALVLAFALGAGPPAAHDDAPEAIQPIRKRWLPTERYRELKARWLDYARAHPADPGAWIQLARVTEYARDSCAEAVRYAERAYQLAPRRADVLATLGAWRWFVYCDGQATDPDPAIGMLEEALALDPGLDDARYRLWVMRLSKGERDADEDQLRELLNRGRIPEPLVDFGYNLLIGLEPDAILLTNGDNDTCPLIALQAARGIRRDVDVVNLSLLNLGWYRRQLAERHPAVPVPLLDQGPRGTGGSDAAVRGLIENLARDGWKRPLYLACTVNRQAHAMPNQLSLEGIAFRVLPKGGAGFDVDTLRIERNLGSLYRLESATSPSLDWDDWQSVRFLMLNYPSAGFQLSLARARAGSLVLANQSMDRAVALSVFHHSDFTPEMIKEWSAWTPNSPELAHWKRQLRL